MVSSSLGNEPNEVRMELNGEALYISKCLLARNLFLSLLTSVRWPASNHVGRLSEKKLASGRLDGQRPLRPRLEPVYHLLQVSSFFDTKM